MNRIIQMSNEYLFYIFKREHKIMRPTDKKLAIEEEGSQVRAIILFSKSPSSNISFAILQVSF